MIADSTSQAHSIKPITNKRGKLEGGDPSDFLIQGSDFMEQAFSSN